MAVNMEVKCGICGGDHFGFSRYEDCPVMEQEYLNEPQPTELMTWECPRCHSIHNELKVTCDCKAVGAISNIRIYDCDNPEHMKSYYSGN